MAQSKYIVDFPSYNMVDLSIVFFGNVYQAGYIVKSDHMILDIRWFPMCGITKSSIKKCHFPSKTHRFWGSCRVKLALLVRWCIFWGWNMTYWHLWKHKVRYPYMSNVFLYNLYIYVHLCSSKLGLCSLLICFTKTWLSIGHIYWFLVIYI